MQIHHATAPEHVTAIRVLFQEYAAWLRADICLQGFGDELATLPGAYALPRGRLLLAVGTDGPVGCVALRPAGDTRCEMKRLFVRSAYRGQGVGRALARRALTEAKAAGYSIMILDTLPFMERAIQLYETLGFARSEGSGALSQETISMELHL